MSKRVKGLMQEQIAGALNDISEFVVLSLYGVEGNDNNRLRSELSKDNISVFVVKNTLAARALKDMGYENVDSLFAGPCAIAVGGSDIVSLAKAIVKWEKELDKLEIKGAFLEGEVLDGKGAVALSKMLTRAEQQGMVVKIALSPATNIAGAVISPSSNIAGCLKTIIDKGEDAA